MTDKLEAMKKALTQRTGADIDETLDTIVRILDSAFRETGPCRIPPDTRKALQREMRKVVEREKK